jgi:hypothetical protein
MSEPDSNPTNPLAQAVLGPHATIQHLARQAASPPAGTDPRERFELLDAYMSVVSRHLCATEAAVTPMAHDALPDGRQRVHDYLHDARGFEQTVHMLKERVYGDMNAHGYSVDDLWHEVDTDMASHVTIETALVEDLCAQLSDEECDRLASRVLIEAQSAASRPHPMTPHTGRLGAVARRVWRLADSFWDTAEGRVVPHRPKPPHPRRESRMTRYVMGAPDFEAERGANETRHGDDQSR